MSDERPNRAYYRAVEGAWGSTLDLNITDWQAFRACPMALLDRLSLLGMVWMTRLFGPFRLETTVDASSAAARDEVIHTTRVVRWGMTLMRSTDTLRLDANGRDATMRIDMRVWPMLWRPRHTAPTPVQIDASGREASYRFPWFGADMRQHGARNADNSVVTLTQDTAFSHGVQVLRRR